MSRFAVIALAALVLQGGCAAAFDEFVGDPPPYTSVYGIDVDGPDALAAAVEACWPAFAGLGVAPPSTVYDDTEVLRAVGNAGAYYPTFRSIAVAAPYAALPHELAHHAYELMYPGVPLADDAQGNHLWPPEIRAALNEAADAIGMGKEQ